MTTDHVSGIGAPIRLKKRLAILVRCLLFLAAGTVGSTVGGWTPIARAESPITYLNYDVNISLQDNGDLRVRLIQRIHFNGIFSEAFFEIPTDYTTGIEEVSVWQGSGTAEHDFREDPMLIPADFSIAQSTGSIDVKWTYAPTSAGETRLFIIEYTAVAALRVHRDRDNLLWQAINSDRSGVAVDSAQITVDLPSYMPMDSVTFAAHGAAHVAKLEGNTVFFEVTEPLADGQGVTVDIEFPHGLVNAQIQDWQKKVDSEYLEVSVDQFTVDLMLEADGTLSVRERMEIEVRNGILYDAFRTVRLLYLDDVDRISVSHGARALEAAEQPCTGCFSVARIARSPDWVYYDDHRNTVEVNDEKSGEVTINWSIQPLYSGDRSVLEIQYRAVGALRVDEDSQLWNWQIVPDFGVPVRSATASVTLPPGVKPQDAHVVISGLDITPQQMPNGTLVLRHDGPVEAGSPWEMTMTLPMEATSAPIPSWQRDFTAALVVAEQAAVGRARAHVLLIVTGLLLTLAVILGSILWWMRFGRRLIRERLSGYTSEPPSSLAPGIVSYLVDGRATAKGILASLFHLATTECLEIRLDETLWVRRLCSERLRVAEYTRARGVDSVTIDRHCAFLFNDIIMPNTVEGRDVSIDDLSGALRSNLPRLYAAMGQDVQKHVLAQQRPLYLANWIPPALMTGWFVFSAIVMVNGFASRGAFGTPAVMIISSFFAVSLFNMARAWLLSKRKRNSWEAEAENWIRFKNYLADLETYGNLAAAQQILQRYFSYAVALGVEQDVLAYSSAIGTVAPRWLILPQTAAAPSGTIGMGKASGPSQPGTTRPRNRLELAVARSAIGRSRNETAAPKVSLSGLSRQMGASLVAASANVGNLLSTAAGDGERIASSVKLNSQLQTRDMTWAPNTPVDRIIDDIMNQSMADTRTIEARRRSGVIRESRGSTGSSGRGRSALRSSGGFRRSQNRSRSNSRSTRSGGGGRSGFG